LDALQCALRDPAISIFRVGWRGQLTPITREDAARLAVNGSAKALLVELT
jgi:hypothetical protein